MLLFFFVSSLLGPSISGNLCDNDAGEEHRMMESNYEQLKAGVLKCTVTRRNTLNMRRKLVQRKFRQEMNHDL